jgi:3-oxoacyl-[acyl-carrier protein] reductase
VDLGLAGRVALVTGASKGLGRACALSLASEGMRVALAARDSTALEDLVCEIGAGPGQAHPLPLDLAEEGAVERAVERVEAIWGGLHVLVANAPGPAAGPVEEITLEQWRSALEMNVLAMVRLTHAVLPIMRRQGDGRIHYISTIGVRTAQQNMVLSNATRLAVMGLAKTLSLEVASDGILVNVFAPGPIETDRMTELVDQTMARTGLDRDAARAVWVDEVPLGRMGDPGDLASLVALLSSPRCSFTTGAVIPVDGGKARGY